jgi:hypothetical protein
MIDKYAPGAYLLNGKWVIDGISELFESVPFCDPFSSGQDHDSDATMRLLYYQNVNTFGKYFDHACDLAEDFVPFGPQDDILVRVILIDYPEVFD